LIKRIEAPAERKKIATKVIDAAQPLPFAVTCFEWIQLPADGVEAARLIAKQHENELGKILAGRVKTRALETPTYTEFPFDALRLFLVWQTYGPDGEVSHYLRNRFEQEANELDDFLATCGQLALWRTEGPLSGLSYAARGCFDAISKLIDPEFVALKLRQTHGPGLDDPRLDDEKDVPATQLIARKFVQIYVAVEQANADRLRGELDGSVAT
jgi:hypothetical protein